ncbi:MAG: hypothetical protein ACTSVL_12860 [Promethearchaeota archaeon]
MGKSSSSIGTILMSVFITLIISGAGMYFGLPYIFPNLTADLDANQDLYTADDGLLLQSKYLETDGDAYLFDDTLTDMTMPDTAMNITIQENSKLLVSFESVMILHMSSDFSGVTRYNITLEIVGVKNRTTRASFFANPGLGVMVETSEHIHITFQTDSLPAGTYSISVSWKSIYDVTTGSSSLNAAGGAFDYTRSLLAQELKNS